jgi:hypothetical protein
MFGAPGASQPNTEFGTLDFGKTGITTNNALGQAGTSSGQNPFYAVGGPRSAQFTVKVMF